MELPHGCHMIEGHEAMDYALVHSWLSSSYWTPGISRERIEHAARNSALVLGVADSHRGSGLARTMVSYAMQHPDFATISTWTLGTKDAQGVYEPLGFRD